MVENKIIQIICNNLSKHITADNVKFHPGNNLLKYLFNIDYYYFEILYYFMDDFYRIKVENKRNNRLQGVVYLTKSKKFQKDIKIFLKKSKLSYKSFENHMSCMMLFLSELLDKYSDLSYLDETYSSDLKFDGIFI